MLQVITYRGEDIKNPKTATIGQVYLSDGVYVHQVLGFNGYGKNDPACMPGTLREIELPEGIDLQVGDIL